MSNSASFTGERFLPGTQGEIAYEHWHRYAYARRYVGGSRVLDVACGEGYGTALLATVAGEAVGADIDAATIAQAGSRYGAGGRVRFVTASCIDLPFPDGEFDVVVSFETIEHLDAVDQPRMLAEFRRVLKSDGLLILSSPNKPVYSDARGYVNEFHRHELGRDDLAQLLSAHFPAQRWCRQRLGFFSAVWADGQANGCESWGEDGKGVAPYAGPEAMYFIVIAARDEALLPAPLQVSLFADVADQELQRSDANARQSIHLDALLKTHQTEIARQTLHIEHLEKLVTVREQIIVERDRLLADYNASRAYPERIIAERDMQLAEVNAAREDRERSLADRDKVIRRLETQAAAQDSETRRLAAALAAQERIIDYRQSARWWLQLPWLRIRRWLDRVR